MNLQICEWQAGHPRWHEVYKVTETLGQTKWVECLFVWHQSSHLLVATSDATSDDAVVGFLRLVTQKIGADDELPPTVFAGKPLVEAKVMAFGVLAPYRRQGIGWALQAAAIELARQLGCYQLRSYSSGDKEANHRLKIAMGFAMHRTVRGNDQQGAYFVMPLQCAL